MPVRPCVGTNLLGYSTDFRENWQKMFVWKSFEKYQIGLKSDKSLGHITWRSKYVLLLLAQNIPHKIFSVQR